MKISFGATLIVVLVLLIASLLSFFWVLLTPRWSFTITTDKTIQYTPTDVIRFTVTLKNTGYIPQTITSAITEPISVMINVEDGVIGDVDYVWDNGFPEFANTSFTIPAGNSMTRTCEFNQSLIEQRYRSDGYIIWIYAVIPKPGVNHWGESDFLLVKDNQLFYTVKDIQIGLNYTLP